GWPARPSWWACSHTCTFDVLLYARDRLLVRIREFVTCEARLLRPLADHSTPLAPRPLREIPELAQRHRQHRRIDHRRRAQLTDQLRHSVDAALVASLPVSDELSRARHVGGIAEHLGADGSLQAGEIVLHRTFGERLPMRIAG